ncbi:MAG: transposase [Deltaproteobacteria bacterium]|nr:transposase [Deltaproteobacteria bacterium]MBW2084968.1 transposase [Deltaproteobacteria bacterium]
MTNIRRFYVPDTAVFMTAVCHMRNTHLKSDANKGLLLTIMREVKAEKPYNMLGYILLDDHFHWMIQIQEKSASETTRIFKKKKNKYGKENQYWISEIMQSVKLRYTYRYKKLNQLKGHVTLWQNRFWDHIVRNQEDFNNHLDYIHYNPVKHGYVSQPLNYRWSSFHSCVEQGFYAPNWAAAEEPQHLIGISWE